MCKSSKGSCPFIRVGFGLVKQAKRQNCQKHTRWKSGRLFFLKLQQDLKAVVAPAKTEQSNHIDRLDQDSPHSGFILFEVAVLAKRLLVSLPHD